MTLRDAFTQWRAGKALSAKSLGHVAAIGSHQKAIKAHIKALKAIAAGKDDVPDADEVAQGDGGVSDLGGPEGTANGVVASPGAPTGDATGSRSGRGMTFAPIEADGFHPLGTLHCETLSFDAAGRRIDPTRPVPVYFDDGSGRPPRRFPFADAGEAR